MKKSCKILLTLLVSFVTLFISIVIIFQIFFPTKMIKYLGFQTYLISYTKSMEPNLNYNDLVLIRRFDFYDLEEGDYITFLAELTNGNIIVVTHQVHDIFLDHATGIRYIQTKGTNLPHPDVTLVTETGFNHTNVYLGKYAGKSELLGNVISYYQSIYGFSALIVNIVCIIAIMKIINYQKPIKPQPRKRKLITNIT